MIFCEVASFVKSRLKYCFISADDYTNNDYHNNYVLGEVTKQNVCPFFSIGGLVGGLK